MASAKQATAKTYIANLPADRRAAISAVREVVLANLPKGYAETISFGMLSYEVPLAVYPETYNKKPLMYAALASQKSYMALYLCNVYADEALAKTFRARVAAAGKKLDMGKSCVRFKKLDDLALDAVAEAVRATPMKAFVERARSLHSKPKGATAKGAKAKR
jgi:hypothetical protein